MELCNICGSDKYKILYESTLKDYKKGDFTYAGSRDTGQIVKCEDCGLIYVYPREDKIVDKYIDSKDELYLKSEMSRKETFKNDLKNIRKIYSKSGRLLDIGCGYGLFLDTAKEAGYDAEGIEISKYSYEYCKSKNHKVHNNVLGECNFENESFDLITMWDLIEHLEDPSSFLKDVNRILNRDGLVVISTPNIGSLFAKARGRSWWCIVRMHLFYFSRRTIKNLLEKNGFIVIAIKSHPRKITLKYAAEWIKDNRILYKILKNIGNTKIKVNFFDDMVVYAKKNG